GFEGAVQEGARRLRPPADGRRRVGCGSRAGARRTEAAPDAAQPAGDPEAGLSQRPIRAGRFKPANASALRKIVSSAICALRRVSTVIAWGRNAPGSARQW